MRRCVIALLASVTTAVVFASPTLAQTTSIVSSGSPPGTTPQNHQNEPAVAMDANAPSTLIAGSNDFVDQAPCPRTLAINNGTCLNRAAGVGLSGVYFSFDSGHRWTQPTYTGWTNSDCDPTKTCTNPQIGPDTPWVYGNLTLNVHLGSPGTTPGQPLDQGIDVRHAKVEHE